MNITAPKRKWRIVFIGPGVYLIHDPFGKPVMVSTSIEWAMNWIRYVITYQRVKAL